MCRSEASSDAHAPVVTDEIVVVSPEPNMAGRYAVGTVQAAPMHLRVVVRRVVV
jgi:hypothetical protein